MTTDTQTQFAPSPDQALAQLSLALVSDLRLHQFLALCEGINKLYQASERLERRMEHWSVDVGGYGAFVEVLPELVIESIEIGTPNHVRLRGVKRGLVAVVSVLTAILGVPVAGTEVQKNRAETQKLETEDKLNQLDLMVKSRAALKAGLITQKDFEAITGQAAEGVRELRTAISRYGILRDGAETYLRDVPPDATKTKQ